MTPAATTKPAIEPSRSATTSAMLSAQEISQHLDNVLEDSAFLGLPNSFRGKVRDRYDLGDKLVLVTTDRQSAFDRVLAAVPFKGQVLNQVSAFWFEHTRDIVPNHVIEVPDPNVTIAKKCDVFPVEFVMRAYLTGSTSTSIWKNYERGMRNYCGHELPDGMSKNQALESPLLTPTTKDDEHDELISAREIVDSGLIDAETWAVLADIAHALFARGQEIAAANGLILVDTKYEMGRDTDGRIVLIDEIHTPDSSRYWLADGYESRVAAGEEPDNIDKEFLRRWFAEHCDPYNDEQLPQAPPELVAELSHRYIRLYETITGAQFEPALDRPIRERMLSNLARFRA